MPVLLHADRTLFDAKSDQLWLLAEAALELGEPGEDGQPDHIVPQLDSELFIQQPTDHRAEEGEAVRGPEVQDRSSDVLSGEGKCLVGIGLGLGVC